MIKSIITFCYVFVCVLLIVVILLQHYRSDITKGSSSYFGGSGNKDFLYRATLYLIFAFFSLALVHTSISYRTLIKDNAEPPVSLPVKKIPPIELKKSMENTP